MPPGRRNQFNTGFQQAFGRYLLLDADYFWKYTDSAYDFSTLLNTTITFPVSWNKSKLDGVTGRAEHHQPGRLPGLLDLRPHPRALLPAGNRRPDPAGRRRLGGGVFRIDHDQAFQSTATFRYQHKHAEWLST